MEASPFRPRLHPRIINNALATHLATKDLKQKQAFHGRPAASQRMAAPRRDFCRSDAKERRGGITGRNLETKRTNQKRKQQEIRSLALLPPFFFSDNRHCC